MWRGSAARLVSPLASSGAIPPATTVGGAISGHVRATTFDGGVRNSIMTTHPVDDDPVMASAIGRCSNHWTHAETTLAWIFSSLTKTDIATAVTVFSFFKSSRTQRDVLKKLAKISPFMTTELRDRLAQVLRIYGNLAEARNQLLHNPIGRSVEHQVYIMVRSATPVLGEVPYQTKPISPSEIDELSAKIKTFNDDLRDIQQAVSDARFAKAHDSDAPFSSLFAPFSEKK
jgi:hypothetical protein